MQTFCSDQLPKLRRELRTSGKLCYSTLCELFKKKLTELGYPAVEFGLHSLRAGGATAVANAGVPDRLFKRHGGGGWTMLKMAQLSVFKSIGKVLSGS